MLWLVNRRGVLDVWFTFVFSRAEEAAAGTGSDCKVSRIYGVVGNIRLLAGSYVLVITSRKDAGSYQGSPVYHVNSMKFLCCNEAIKHLTPQERRDEAYFMSLLRIAETTCGLYYSYDRDLTLKNCLDCLAPPATETRVLWFGARGSNPSTEKIAVQTALQTHKQSGYVVLFHHPDHTRDKLQGVLQVDQQSSNVLDPQPDEEFPMENAI